MAGSYHTTESQLAGVQVQTSLLGQPIAIGWGRGRLSCNLIDYVGFKAIPQTTKTGGKGGSSTSTTYTYSASIIMALCEGPITGIRTVYKDSSALTSLSAAGLSLATGTSSQTPWGYMSSLYPSHALGYRGIAYVYAQDYALGGQASLPNHGFEVDFAIQFGPNGDADPKDIVTDYLTNVDYGVTGWASGLIGDLSNYSTYCKANNLLLSPVLDQGISGQDFLKRVFDQTNSVPVWSEGVLKVKPLGDTSATGNSVTWTANLTPVYDLDETDFLDEVELEVVDQSDASNYVQVEYLDRSNQYQPAVAIAQDLDNIILFGKRKKDPVQYHDICDASIAQVVAQLLLQTTLYRRDRYTFALPEDFVGLEGGDYVTLSTTVDGMVLNRQLVWIESIEEDAEGNLQLTAWGVPGQTASAAQYTAHTSAGYQPAVDVAPGSVSAPMLMLAPSSVTGLDPEVWIAAGGSSPNWGGCQVWVSGDNTTFQMVGVINNAAAMGTLTASLPDSASDPDTTNTLSVDMTPSGQTLLSSSSTNQANGATLFMVDNELMTYQTATLTSTLHYNLTTLGRGKLGTSHASHASGAKFARIDDAIFKLPYNKLNFGSTMYVKLVSFNIYGRGLEDISTLPSYSVALSSTPTDWRVVASTDPVVASLSKTSVTLGAYANGGVTDFSQAVTQLSVKQGATDIMSSATLTITPTGCTATINTAANTPVSGQPKGYVQVTAMTGTAASVLVTATVGGVGYTVNFSINTAQGGIERLSANPTTNLFDGREYYNTTDGRIYQYTAANGWNPETAAPVGANMLIGAVPGLNAQKYFQPGWNPDGVSYYNVLTGGSSTSGAGIIQSPNFGWAPGTGWTLPDNGTLGVWQNNATWGTTNVTDFSFMRVVDASGATSMLFDVEGGKTYEWSIYSGAHRCKVWALLIFVGADGTTQLWNNDLTDPTSYNDEAAAGGTTLGGYKRIYARGKAPAAAKYAWCMIRKGHTKPGLGYTDSWLFAAHEQFCEIPIGQVDLTPYSVPAFAYLNAENMVARSITTDRIKAGAVTVAEMYVTQLSTITADVGLLRTATSGARTEIEGSQRRIYNSAGVMILRDGHW